MAITEEQNEQLTDMLSDIQGNMSLLNDWERGFIKDQIERFDKYGVSIFLSPKQWSTIRSIHEKVAGPQDEEPPADEDDYGVDDEIPF